MKTFCFSPFKTVTANLTSFENSIVGQKIFDEKRIEKLSSRSKEEKVDSNNNHQDALLEKKPEEIPDESLKSDLERTSFDPEMTLTQATLSWRFIASVIFFMFMTLR